MPLKVKQVLRYCADSDDFNAKSRIYWAATMCMAGLCQ